MEPLSTEVAVPALVELAPVEASAVEVPLPSYRPWSSRPLHVGLFAGGIEGADVVRHQIGQTGPGIFAGLSYGWDFHEHWGTEKRLGYGALRVANQNGPPEDRVANAFLGEYRLLYYPLPEARVRPYFISGLGIADYNFTNDQGGRVRTAALLAPLGVGVKTMLSSRVAARIELVDDFSFAGRGVSEVNNVVMIAGLEMRFGMPKRPQWLGGERGDK